MQDLKLHASRTSAMQKKDMFLKAGKKGWKKAMLVQSHLYGESVEVSVLDF